MKYYFIAISLIFALLSCGKSENKYHIIGPGLKLSQNNGQIEKVELTEDIVKHYDSLFNYHNGFQIPASSYFTTQKTEIFAGIVVNADYNEILNSISNDDEVSILSKDSDEEKNIKSIFYQKGSYYINSTFISITNPNVKYIIFQSSKDKQIIEDSFENACIQNNIKFD